mmetsp:Transcript_18098/g.31401  ORF Transcript_18098/g.31401 Transcript_18098/m.31401 type:complete len:255 (-) Transcript_18098:1426-2190(-)
MNSTLLRFILPNWEMGIRIAASCIPSTMRIPNNLAQVFAADVNRQRFQCKPQRLVVPNMLFAQIGIRTKCRFHDACIGLSILEILNVCVRAHLDVGHIPQSVRNDFNKHTASRHENQVGLTRAVHGDQEMDLVKRNNIVIHIRVQFARRIKHVMLVSLADLVACEKPMASMAVGALHIGRVKDDHFHAGGFCDHVDHFVQVFDSSSTHATIHNIHHRLFVMLGGWFLVMGVIAQRKLLVWIGTIKHERMNGTDW